jgi:hypothetical protein
VDHRRIKGNRLRHCKERTELSVDELVRRSQLEEETIKEVMKILRAEFE